MIGTAYEMHIPGRLYIVHKPFPLLNLCENYLILGKQYFKQNDLIFCLKSEIKNKGTEYQHVESHFLFGSKTLIFNFTFTINDDILDLYK